MLCMVWTNVSGAGMLDKNLKNVNAFPVFSCNLYKTVVKFSMYKC